MQLDTWLFRLRQQNTQANSMSELVKLIHQPPYCIWKQYQFKTISAWLEGCLKLSSYFDELGHSEQAYQYIQLAYARIQSMTADPHADLELRYWGAAYLDQLTVAMIEFCQSHQGWGNECYQAIELHIAFMTPLGELNMRERPRPT
ncbi:hypothetical protein [Vibrio gangliei]|uniref:hypothetical protein n=1 Tax=Vibrio gangliei TaxID=2077090 RepID=UPI000D0167D8|nr:hypothetical protein [Vibrio gangliei]